MAFDTKINLSCTKVEQTTGDTLNLSGTTSFQSGSTLSILPNHGDGKVLGSDTSGTATWNLVVGSGGTTIVKVGDEIRICSTDPTGTTVSWGNITGTLSNQTDLQSCFDDIHTFTGTTDTCLTELRTDVDAVSGLTETKAAWTGSTANGIGTYVDGTYICSEPNLTFDGSLLTVSGDLEVTGTTCTNIICEYTATSGVTIEGGLIKDNILGDSNNYWEGLFTDEICLCYSTGTDYSHIYTNSTDSLYLNAGNGSIYHNTASVNNSVRAVDNTQGTNFYSIFNGTSFSLVDSGQTRFNINASQFTGTRISDDANAFGAYFWKERISGGKTANVNDQIFRITGYFYNDNASPQTVEGIRIRGIVDDVTDDSEDAHIEFHTRVDGTLTNLVNIGGGGLCVNQISEHTASSGVTINNVITMSGLGSDDTEDHVIAIDDSTGLLTKRSIDSIISGSTYWDRDTTGVPFLHPTTTNDNLSLRNFSDTATGGALYFYKERIGPPISAQDYDTIGTVSAYFRNDNVTPEYIKAGEVAFRVIDVSDGSEDTRIQFQNIVDGSATSQMFIDTQVDILTSLKVDTICEYTGAAGVTIEGVQLKDSDVCITGTNNRLYISGSSSPFHMTNNTTMITENCVYSNSAGAAVYWNFNRFGGTEAVPAVVPTSADIFVINAEGYDGSSSHQVARIESSVSGAVGVGSISGTIILHTRETTGGLAPRLTVYPDGDVAVMGGELRVNTIEQYSAGVGVIVEGICHLNGDLTGTTICATTCVRTATVCGTTCVRGNLFCSTVTTGTAPVQVASTTLNTNLNADLLDGFHASALTGDTTAWGCITGTLSNQTDLNDCLNARALCTDVYSQTVIDNYTGTTVPNNYYNKTEINSNTGATDSRLDCIETNYVTGGTNLGSGTCVYDSKSGQNLQFNQVVGSGGTEISLVGNQIRVCSTDPTGTTVAWGSVTGDITNQGDLMSYLGDFDELVTGNTSGVAANEIPVYEDATGKLLCTSNATIASNVLTVATVCGSTIARAPTIFGSTLVCGATVCGTSAACSPIICGTTCVRGNLFCSTVSTGTSPVQVASTTLNTNLNADLLDGLHASALTGDTTAWGCLTGTLSNQTDLQGCFDDIYAFTGTTLPNNYYNKTQIDSYTGDTDTTLDGLRTDVDAVSGLTVTNDGRLDYIEPIYITGATNLGSGNGTLYTSVSDHKIQLKTLFGGTNVTITCDGNCVCISAPDTSGIEWSGSQTNGIGTYVDADTICSEPNLCFDGSVLSITGVGYASSCFCSPQIEGVLVSGTTVCGSSMVRSGLAICSDGCVFASTHVYTTCLDAASCVVSPLISGTTVCGTTCVRGPKSCFTNFTGETTCGDNICGNSVYTTTFFCSTATTGTEPIQVNSTTLNTNLNADLLDGFHASQLSGDTTYTFSDGLTKTGSNVTFGGLLTTQSAVLSGGSFNLYLGTTDSEFSNIYINASGALQGLSSSLYFNGSTDANYKGGNFCLRFTTTDAILYDTSSGQHGIKYDECISTGFTSDCSLVDKGYVDICATSHSHGCINCGGCVGSTTGCVLCTGTNGCVGVASTATPSSHVHGNLNNGGCVGSASGCVVCTTTSGCVTTTTNVACATDADTLDGFHASDLTGTTVQYWTCDGTNLCPTDGSLIISGTTVCTATLVRSTAVCGTSCVRGGFLCSTGNAVVDVTLTGAVVCGNTRVQSPIIQLSTGAAAGCFMCSNANGCGVWVTLPASETITASNGLTKVDSNITLGGALTGNSSITGNYTLGVTGCARINTECGIQISGTTMFDVARSTLNNLRIGEAAGANYAGGVGNVAIGKCALCSNTTGTYNTGVGFGALRLNQGGVNNVAIGNQAIYTGNGGDDNVAIGFSTLVNTTGNNNVAIGECTLRSNVAGACNIAIGCDALEYNVSGNNNIAMGAWALWCSCGSCNVGIGTNTLISNTTGCGNIAIGANALNRNTTSICNVAVGTYALFCNSEGRCNVGVGTRAGYLNSTGYDNVFIGQCAGYSNTGSNSVHIGKHAGCGETTANRLHIANAGTCSLIYGEFDNKLVCIDGKLVTCEFRVISGATNGYVLTSDASGNATWQQAQTGGTSDISVSNGLSNDGINITLGGTLTGATTINATATNDFFVCTTGGADLLWKVGDTIYACYNSGGGAGSRFLINQSSVSCMGYQNASGEIGFITDATTCSALRRSQGVSDCHYFGVFSSGATIYSSDNMYAKGLSEDSTEDYLVAIDSASGQLSYRTVSGVTTSGASNISCAINGDDTTTGWTVTHGLSTRDVQIEVYKNVSPYPTIYTDVSRPTTDTVCVTFESAPATGCNYMVLVNK